MNLSSYHLLLFLACLLIFFLSCESVYVLIGTEPKCYTLEKPRDTPMVFKYEIIDLDHHINFDIYAGEKPSPEVQLKHKELYKVGHIDYIAEIDGIYTYCLQQSSPQRTVSRIKLFLSYGFDDYHYHNLLKQHNFDTVNLYVHKLNDLLTMTLNEADYMKHKEVQYHQETEKMNTASLWWPVLQIGILVVTGIYQVRHLKNFFKSNKLI